MAFLSVIENNRQLTKRRMTIKGNPEHNHSQKLYYGRKSLKNGLQSRTGFKSSGNAKKSDLTY
jgi:hypothetical protein